MSGRPARSVSVGDLARVEGEGGISVRIRKGGAVEVALRFTEPPRLFEALLRGRSFREAPDLTARICGICPVAYQLTSALAMESLCGVAAGPSLRDLRRLLCCGEWIESHALHVVFLHAPDFLGLSSALDLAKENRGRLEAALALKKAGNLLVRAVAGREIHPVAVKVGGFWKAPARETLNALVPQLLEARDLAGALVKWVAGFSFPDQTCDLPLVALRHAEEYPMNEGRIVSTTGLDIEAAAFERHVSEEQVPRSHALHASLAGHGPYLVGPLARYSLNAATLSPRAREAAREAGLGPTCRNPFRSIVVRAVETLHACEEALRLIARYEPPEPPALPVEPRAGTGCAATEAPRGLLYHRYRLDEGGIIREARIVPPTAQNQAAIERDLLVFVAAHRDLDTKALTLRCEQVVRNHDPCISCATHLVVVRREER